MIMVKDPNEYNKLYNPNNFVYLDVNNNVCQYEEFEYFDIDYDKYIEMKRVLDNYGVCYLMGGSIDESSGSGNDEENTDISWIGMVTDVIEGVNLSKGNRYCVKFALHCKYIKNYLYGYKFVKDSESITKYNMLFYLNDNYNSVIIASNNIVEENDAERYTTINTITF